MRLYFASDIHGSTKCWKKFLAAAEFYQADALVMGGDITGKFVVPLIEESEGVFSSRFLGRHRRIDGADELRKLTHLIADAGQYAYRTTPEEYAFLRDDQSRIDGLFRRLVKDRLHEWITLAEERLKGSGVRCFVSGGNDDFFEVDEAIAESDVLEDPNGRVLPLEDGLEILGMGYGNMTPWKCPRDIPEEELLERIDLAALGLRDSSRAIFSLHVPPLGSELDRAPKLDDELRIVMTSMGPDMIPVGSTATREAISRYKPLIGLHGHIHESRGVRRLDGVPICNPGSEYAEGVLSGAIVELNSRQGLKGVQLVTG